MESVRALVVINEKFLENFGDSSLLGYLVNKHGRLPNEVILLFQESSYGYRQQHGGPNVWAAHEFVPRCLINDILTLISRGVKVTTDVEIRDPS